MKEIKEKIAQKTSQIEDIKDALKQVDHETVIGTCPFDNEIRDDFSESTISCREITEELDCFRVVKNKPKNDQ